MSLCPQVSGVSIFNILLKPCKNLWGEQGRSKYVETPFSDENMDAWLMPVPELGLEFVFSGPPWSISTVLYSDISICF